MRSRIATGLAVTALAILLSGCGGTGAGGGAGNGYSAPSPDTSTTQTPAPATKTGLMTADSDLGKIVVDAAGMTVYMFDNDTQGAGTSTCSGQCASNWPAVTTDSDQAPAVEGVTGEVGTITGVDGKTQVTLNGWPLYYYAGDSAAGDTNGQGVGGIWWVLDPAGEKISG